MLDSGGDEIKAVNGTDRGNKIQTANKQAHTKKTAEGF
jgi:hypothetical protein